MVYEFDPRGDDRRRLNQFFSQGGCIVLKQGATDLSGLFAEDGVPSIVAVAVLVWPRLPVEGVLAYPFLLDFLVYGLSDLFCRGHYAVLFNRRCGLGSRARHPP